MRSYFIFAIVLTVAYLIYYAVIIMQDLYGKRSTGKTEEEVFDLGTLEDEESVAVSESETGFRVGNEQYDTETASGGDSATDQKPADKKPETKETPEERLERLKANAEEKMEETTPYLSDGFSADEMYKAMLPGANWKIVRRWPGNQLKTNCSMSIKQKIVCLLILVPYAAFAKSGSVNYSWGADALATMHDFVVTMMLYVLYICYSIASVLVIVSAFQIYIKMNTGEDGIVKSFLSLLGACLFIIGASIVLPAFFGYRI